MHDRVVTARSRELGAELRGIREGTGRSQAQIAKELGWSASRVCRLETGARGVTELDVARLLTVCRVTGTQYERLLALSRNSYERSWLRSNNGHAFHERRMLVHHETTATRISEYEPLAIPELLRTEQYVRAVLALAGLEPEAVVDETVRAHVERRAIFQRAQQPTFAFFISEHVLRSPIGDPHVMNDQLLYLVLAASRPDCAIRIVPSSLGPSGLLGGPFRIMEYPGDPPVTHTHSQTASVFLQEPDDIANYRAILARLDALALTKAQTRDLLADLADSHDRPEADLP